MSQEIYALYKGDTFICTGTIYEVSKSSGLSIPTLKYYGSESYKLKLEGKNSRNAKILIRVEDDEK
jgi:hypothetical protein